MMALGQNSGNAWPARTVGIELVEPVEVVSVAGEDAEDFKFKPAHAQRDGGDAQRENYAGDKGIDRILAERDSGEGKQEGKTR